MILSRKQELYREILRGAQLSARMGFARFMVMRPFLLLSRRQQRHLRAHYEIAQLVHSLSGSLWDEDFTDHDLWFLNKHARAFLERNTCWNCYLYPQIAYYIQELFQAVPEDLRHKLEWPGPTEDYAWAISQDGDEP